MHRQRAPKEPQRVRTLVLDRRSFGGDQPMPKWEYMKIDLNSIPLKTNDIDLFNAAGESGGNW
jgi:hypothetical protein